MAEPAAATAHMTGAPSAVTAPSQQGPATSNQGQVWARAQAARTLVA